MKQKEMETKILSMIEELNPNHELLTDDPDIAGKIVEIINQVQFELARMKKIPAYATETVSKDEVFELKLLPNFYQLNKIKCESAYEIVDNMVMFDENGTATFFYYRYPERITDDNKDEYEFELTEDCLEIMPYGVAADIFKSDQSMGYGKFYAERYADMLQRLDPRHSVEMHVYFEGGVDL